MHEVGVESIMDECIGLGVGYPWYEWWLEVFFEDTFYIEINRELISCLIKQIKELNEIRIWKSTKFLMDTWIRCQLWKFFFHGFSSLSQIEKPIFKMD